MHHTEMRLPDRHRCLAVCKRDSLSITTHLCITANTHGLFCITEDDNEQAICLQCETAMQNVENRVVLGG